MEVETNELDMIASAIERESNRAVRESLKEGEYFRRLARAALVTLGALISAKMVTSAIEQRIADQVFDEKHEGGLAALLEESELSTSDNTPHQN